jgi:hypothetical protein
VENTKHLEEKPHRKAPACMARPTQGHDMLGSPTSGGDAKPLAQRLHRFTDLEVMDLDFL